jgi:hypothetical protein
MTTQTKRVGFRLTPDLYRRLEREADLLGLSLSDTARVRLAESLASTQQKTAPSAEPGAVQV